MFDILKDMTGLRFGKLTVLCRAEDKDNPGGCTQTCWQCECQCKVTMIVRAGDLRRTDGKAVRSCRSCGATRHGHTRPGWQSITYQAWRSMLGRCQRCMDYVNKSIVVCERWRSFRNFLADMGERPSRLHTLDRFPDNDGNYEPGNCRWATKTEQARNTSHNVWLTIDGETMVLMDWLRRLGVSTGTYYYRVRHGMSPVEAILTPINVHVPKTAGHRAKLSAAQPKALTGEQKQQAVAMRRAGATYASIVAVLGVSMTTIVRACRAPI